MGWLHKVLHGDEADSVPPTLGPADLVPPPLPRLPSDDPATAHKRGYASKVCPSCEAGLDPLPTETTVCDACGEPIVVVSGEDGQWHLLREADFAAFDERQEEIRGERYKADVQTLMDAGFLAGDVQVDVVGEADYQAVLERMAGGRSRYGDIKPVVALLTREPDHAHEKNAVRVDVDGETVGYVEKWNAKEIQPLMHKMEKAGRPAWVRAWIVGGWEDDHGDDSFRIRLDSLPKVS